VCPGFESLHRYQIRPSCRDTGEGLFLGGNVMDDITGRVRDTIQTYSMISTRDTVLAAVSGGPDSVCMLHVLLGLREELGFDVKVAHLDHQFRGEESTGDADFVTALAARLDLPCISEQVNVPEYLMSHRMSKQEAARMLRYRFLIRVSKLEYCQRIATAHNADDQAETVLMRILRGAGPDGLAGIPPKRDGTIIRPLLRVWRSEIEAYLSERGLESRLDSSNVESKYLRNRIRNELIPLLTPYNSNIRGALVNLGTIMTDVVAHADRMTDEALPHVVKSAKLGQFVLDSDKLAGYDRMLRRSILRRVFEHLRPDLAPLPFHHVENLLSLLRRCDVGTSVELPDGARATLEHGCLVMSHGHGPPEIQPLTLEVPGAATSEHAGLTVTAKTVPADQLGAPPEKAREDTAYFDWREIRPPLTVRPRREGDRFRPFGMEGTKSLKELFIDSKIAASFRSAVPIVCDASDILWVVGLRRSAKAPVTPATREVLVITAQATEDRTGTRQDPAHGRPDSEESR
jgi:tRNA(Ile)-lysidine synthase